MESKESTEPVQCSRNEYVFVRIDDTRPSRTTVGGNRVEVIVRDGAGEMISRVRELNDDELNFVTQAQYDRRVLGATSAIKQLSHAIWQASGCPLPTNGSCVHPAHIERRAHYAELAEFFGLVQ
jgi:hypothetical protein